MTRLKLATCDLTTRKDYQSGVVTTFTGVIILVMLTLTMFFALRVGVFDQRDSANDMRGKQAFHTAESGISSAKEYFRKYTLLVASPILNLLPDGSDGWLSLSAERWLKCSGAGLDLAAGSRSHPCFGEPVPARRPNLYYYAYDNVGGNYVTTGTVTETHRVLPLKTDELLPGTGEIVSVEALLCVMDVDYTAATPVKGCSTDLTIVDGSYYMITLLARAQADCVGTVCNAEALVREQVSKFGAAAGGQAPAVPLVLRTSFPPSGDAEIVANPNAGGIGVPVSVWMNANASCGGSSDVIDPTSGAWATCEAHEWYGLDALPEDFTCTGLCSCSQEEAISYTKGTEDILGIDLVQDPNFPCDLFQFYFGVPRTNYEVIKGIAQILYDCSTLGPNSYGIIWITGDLCTVNANTQIGSPKAPVLLIAAASETRFNGGAKVYGTLFLSDVEDPAATFFTSGTNQVYGQAIVDGAIGSYVGTFQIIYNEKLVSVAAGQGGLGSVIGGWSDFHPNWN